MNFKGMQILVFGTGKSGIGAAHLLEELGAKPILFDGNDKADAEWCHSSEPSFGLSQAPACHSREPRAA